MSVTMAAGMAVVLASITAFTPPDEPPDDQDRTCRHSDDCPLPPALIGGPPPADVHGEPGHERPEEDPAGHENVHTDEEPAGEAPPPEDTVPTSRRKPPGRIALAAAKSALGTPYSWGGGSPTGPTRGIAHGRGTVGFDCSGLALYAWAQAGVKLTHYTGTQFRQGRKIDRADLRPGDLVFFGPPSGDPNHVGVYVDDGVMIHAPQTGEVVKKTSFEESPYYSNRYRGAVRPRRHAGTDERGWQKNTWKP